MFMSLKTKTFWFGYITTCSGQLFGTNADRSNILLVRVLAYSLLSPKTAESINCFLYRSS